MTANGYNSPEVERFILTEARFARTLITTTPVLGSFILRPKLAWIGLIHTCLLNMHLAAHEGEQTARRFDPRQCHTFGKR